MVIIPVGDRARGGGVDHRDALVDTGTRHIALGWDIGPGAAGCGDHLILGNFHPACMGDEGSGAIRNARDAAAGGIIAIGPGMTGQCAAGQAVSA
jgi:hypothetical protein